MIWSSCGRVFAAFAVVAVGACAGPGQSTALVPPTATVALAPRPPATATAGPRYLTREQAEAHIVRPIDPVRVRSHLMRYAEAIRMVAPGRLPSNGPPEADAMVWLVVSDNCATPSGLHIATPEPGPVFCFSVFDAVTGQMYGGGSGRGWPPGLPPDTPEELARDRALAMQPPTPPPKP